MYNKHKLTAGALGLIAVLFLAVHFDLASAMYGSPSAPKSSSASGVQNVKKTTKKTKKKKTPKVTKPQGTWHVVGLYSGPGPDGPFTPNANLNGENSLELTFKGSNYCRSDYKDPIDDAKPFCEPIIFNADGTFTGSRLQAFGGFMKLSGGKLEFLEGGMGYTKYVLEKSK